MIKLFLLVGVGCLLTSGVLYAEKRRKTRPMTEQECLAWLHRGDVSYPDGHSAMLSQTIRNPPRLTTPCIAAAHKEIREYADKLVAAGRYTLPGGASGIFTEIARHQWFLTARSVAENHASNWSGNDSDPFDTQMGMYVFDQYLFDLAMRSWHTNVFMEKGSDIVRAPDIMFDRSVVGFQTYVVTDQDQDGDDCKTHQAKLDTERKAREAKGRTLQDNIDDLNRAGTTAIRVASSESYISPPEPQPSTVVEFIDPHTIRISRKAKSCADGWAAMFVPPEWSRELCNCTH